MANQSAGEQERRQRTVWVVDGGIKDALSTRVERSKLYWLASSCLGLYDGNNKAFWYDNDKALRFHVLFTEETEARRFHNWLFEHTALAGSHDRPCLPEVSLTRETRASSDLCNYIIVTHYVAEEVDILHGNIAACSDETFLIDLDTDEFRFQGIESRAMFGRYCKVEGCQIVPHTHCRHCESCYQYMDEPSNRLALFRELRGFYDGLNVTLPVLNITAESVSPEPVIEGRYAVHLLIRALTEEYGRLIAKRLKEGSQVSDDFMEMRTVVHVENPEMFCECLAWRAKQIDKRWKLFFVEGGVDNA